MQFSSKTHLQTVETERQSEAEKLALVQKFSLLCQSINQSINQEFLKWPK